jgi:putative transposase
MFASTIRRKRIDRMRNRRQWRWHLGEVFVNINRERYYRWHAVNHEEEVLESLVTK